MSASLADAELARQSLLDLKSDPPAIVFSTELAVLLMYDGAPRFGDSTAESCAARPYPNARAP